jgi:nucleoside-diphosphate-sugar epimerase
MQTLQPTPSPETRTAPPADGDDRHPNRPVVFVTGGTGVLGRATVPRLIAAGYRVRALARSEAAAERLAASGAEPVRGQLFDLDVLRGAVAAASVVAHLATRIPPVPKQRALANWAENDRVRHEGMRHLVDAARAADVGTIVYPSIAFVYPDSGDRWIDATSTPPKHPPLPVLRSTLAAEREVARFTAGGGRGVVLRMAGFYGPDAPSTHEMLAAARRGIAPVPGPLGAYHPTVWVDDAAAAVVAALAPRVPAGVYDVVDDEPLAGRALIEVLARAVGRRSLWRIPAFVVRRLLPVGVELGRLSLRVSNRRFRAASDWAPTVPNARLGWERLARAGPAGPAPATAASTVPHSSGF